MNNIYQAPEATLTKPAEVGEYGSVEKALAGDYDLTYGTILSEAWEKVKGAKLAVFLAGIIYYVIYLAAIFGVTTILVALGMSMSDPLTGQTQPGASATGIILGFIVQTVILTLITAPLVAGFIVMGLRRSIGNDISAGTVVSQYSKVIPFSITILLQSLLIAIGFLLLVIPGIYLCIAYFMALPLVVDKGMSPWTALETSRKAVTKKWFRHFGLILLISLAFIVGALALGIGLIWTTPLALFAYAIAYRNMFGVEASTLDN